MSLDAALQILDDGHIIVDTQHVDARTLLQQLNTWGRIYAYSGRYVRAKIDRVTLWNAAAQGIHAGDVITILRAASQDIISTTVQRTITTLMERWGRLWLEGDFYTLSLVSDSPKILDALIVKPSLVDLLGHPLSDTRIRVDPLQRANLKRALTRLGWPVDDRASLAPGDELRFDWNHAITLRQYQLDAVDSAERTSHGVIVLPPGSGKTFVGVALASRIQRHTLVVTTSRAAVQQWIDSFMVATTLAPSHIDTYQRNRPLPAITVTTYHQLIATPERINQADWGVILYDEVHTLPAPIFRTTATLASRRRYGLSATLVREDNRIGDVFSLVGPQRYQLPWRMLETLGYIADVTCYEISVSQTRTERMAYMEAAIRQQGRLAAITNQKYRVVEHLVAQHADETILIIGHYLEQLHALAKRTGWPMLTGADDNTTREHVYNQVREGHVRVVILSRIGNQAIDIPRASVLIQLSGSYGSRQEEAQRLGRILRPKSDVSATFYTLVTSKTREVDDAWQRQQFLLGQGYRYQHISAEELLG
ncbi:MAG: hypothetical protein RI985_1101 [Chloroflexota bacterium]|jgi:DNA excision repair protein ERCC-3